MKRSLLLICSDKPPRFLRVFARHHLPLKPTPARSLGNICGVVLSAAASSAALVGSAVAGELVYQPVNPNFGGNPINGSYLLSTAQSQNDFKDPSARGSSFSQRSALDRFTDSLESRLLNQLIGDIGHGNAGTLVTEDFIVDIVDQDGVLTVRITDLETNETSEIEVSGLDPNN